jgi:hypothetical protein
VVIGGGYIKFEGFAVVHQKITGLLGRATKPRLKTGRGCLAKTSRTGLENRLTGLGSQGTGSFEAEYTRQDRKACVEATRSAVAGHLSDGATKTNSQNALGKRVS